MPPRKASARRKKPSPATATTAVDHRESPTPEVETGAELMDAVVVKVEEEKETEMSVQVEVSDHNPAEVDGDSTKGVPFSSESIIKEEVGLENCALDDVNAVNYKIGESDWTSDKEKVDLRQGSEDVDEGKQGVVMGEDGDGAVCIDGSQLEAVAVVKGDGDVHGEGIAEVISVQESSITKAPCEDTDALVVEDGGNGEKMGTAEIISTQESAQVVNTEAPCEDNTVLAVIDESNEDVDYEESDNDSEGDDEDSEGEEDPSLFVEDPLTDNKKDKNIEIYVGRLDKNTVEDDLVNVFQQFGELKSTRIVRNSTTKKSKGFAFVQFATLDQAKRALSELKDGVEVRGKHVNISASQDNDTLYLGNICKTWTKEEVLQQLKHYGIEHIETIRLPDDSKNVGKTKGFAFLEFSTHSDAVAACQRLRKPDAIFGRDISAKVAFAEAPLHPSDEVLSQIKRVYVEGLTKSWNEEKVKEICKQYGEIVKVDLCQSSGTKRKDFGFVTFTSHESAAACVEGINSADIGGDIKIKASIAKPQQNSRLQKQRFRGGFKVEKQSEASPLKKDAEISKGGLNSQQAKRKRNESSKQKIKASIANPNKKGPLKKQSFRGESSKDAELSKMKGDLNSQQAKRKRKTSSEQNLRAPPESRHRDQGIPKRSKNGNEGQNSRTALKAGTHKRKPSRYDGREDGGNRNTHNQKPFKKQKGNMQGGERDNSKNSRGDTRIRRGHDDYRNSTRYVDPYAPKYVASSAYHLGPDPMSASTRHYKEMEPHAGYIESASTEHSRSYSGYVQPVVQTHRQHQTVYLEPGAGSQSHLHSRYLDPPVITQSHRGYIETAVGAGVQSYGGYRQSAIVQIAHDPYSPGLARAVRDDGRGASGLAYVGEHQLLGPPLPASQVRNHTSYAGYRASGSYGGSYGGRRTYY